MNDLPPFARPGPYRRNSKYRIVTCLLFAAITIVPFLKAQTLKVVTMNIWSGLDYRGTFRMGEYEPDSIRTRRLLLLAERLRKEQPDIVALQECNPVGLAGSFLAENLGYDYIAQRANGGLKIGYVGIPANLNEGLVLLAKKELRLDFVDVADLSGALGAFGNDFSLHASDENIALIGSVKIGPTRLLIVNTHLSAAVPDEDRVKAKMTELMIGRKMPEDEREAVSREFHEQSGLRIKEVARLREFLEARTAGAPVILLGDFNAAPEAEEIDSIRVQFVDCTPEPQRGEPTWNPAVNPNTSYSTKTDSNATVLEELSAWYDGLPRRIDHIFLNGRFSAADIRSTVLFANNPELGLFPSDHFGLMTEIDLSRLKADSLQTSSDAIHSPGESFEFLPLASYDTDVGFGYGVKAFFLDFAGVSESFDLILFNSTKGERWYRLVFSVPDFELRQGKRYVLSLDVVVDYDKYTKNNFFGIGASSRASDRETYTKEPLEIQLVASRGFTERFVGQLGLRFKMVRNFRFDSTGLFAATAPVNLGRSQGLTFVVSVRYDSRDSYVNPSRGNVAQLDLEGGSSGFLGDYDIFSSTMSLQTYHVLFYPKTVLAARIVGQAVSGKNLPVYVYGTLGGTRTLRGFPQDRFLDRTSVLANIELRFPIVWRFDGVVFYDAGKLAPDVGKLAIFKKGWKINPGFGLRLVMDTFIVRADLGVSSEGTGFYFNFGHLF